MKKFGKTFLKCYILTSIVLICIFGNMNFFGEQGFHLDIEDVVIILLTWALGVSIIISIVAFAIRIILEKNDEKCRKK